VWWRLTALKLGAYFQLLEHEELHDARVAAQDARVAARDALFVAILVGGISIAAVVLGFVTFTKQWMEQRLYQSIAKELIKVLGREVEIEFVARLLRSWQPRELRQY